MKKLILNCFIVTSYVFGSAQNSALLDGQSYDVKIRPKGILYIFSGMGELNFKDGHMYWDAGDGVDMAPYTIVEHNGKLTFTVEYKTNYDGGMVYWFGTITDNKISTMRSEWHRNPGSFYHDLLLPDVVHFTYKFISTDK